MGLEHSSLQVFRADAIHSQRSRAGLRAPGAHPMASFLTALGVWAAVARLLSASRCPLLSALLRF